MGEFFDQETSGDSVDFRPVEPSDSTGKNAVAAPPDISLPKGGGAVRGIDEKFAVSPSTGVGSLSLPLPLTPGRSGFTPSLSLSYESGNGNGPFGLGWSLRAGSISRKTDKSLPRYWDGDNSDVFLLSGGEDLVPALTPAGEKESFERDGFRILRYRPRTEGLFARIERWTNVASGNVHWRTVTPQNVTSIYGGDSHSRLSDPKDPRRVLSWLIESSSDDRGNTIRFDYKAENGDGVSASDSFELNRLPDRFANRYLKHVLYGNRTPFQFSDWRFQVVFDYGEHDDDAPAPEEIRPWARRADSFSSFRGGFDLRTHRLCRRVLMFHQFSQLGPDPCLVRSMDFQYKEDPSLSKLRSVVQSGYVRTNGVYTKSSLPPLDFAYTESLPDQTVRVADESSMENAPAGLAGGTAQWVDLDGEGLSGLLSEQGGGWYYKRNGGNGRFGPMETIPIKPSWGLSGGVRLMDLANEGKTSLVDYSGPTPGFFPRETNGEWGSFTAFPSIEKGAGREDNRRFLDLNGDGVADVLITEDDVLAWRPSLGKGGFGPLQTSPYAEDEEQGPRLAFSNPDETIFLADMSGDGMADIVRIRSGEICYWPNLGYGRFGDKVTMAHSPLFDAPDQFQPSRIRLADVDGSGPTDLLYLSQDNILLWRNLSGNAWSAPRSIPSPSNADGVTDVSVLDFLGDGTACVVWSSSLPGDAGRPIRYLSLTGGIKPHLLSSVQNNRGALTRLRYLPSTAFYLRDLRAGIPWITKLPFPVHVVERSETIDQITGSRFVTSYSYHHGFYDLVEKEFRGFGRVETTDTEDIAAFQGAGLFPNGESEPEEAGLRVPPVLTKTWYHTGAFLNGESMADKAAAEYYAGDALSAPTPTVFPTALSDAEMREACRALKGRLLRREIYALDGTNRAPHPFTVSQEGGEVVKIQPKGKNLHGVFLAMTRDKKVIHYERQPDDPRIQHDVVLETDAYGNALTSVSIGYPRRVPLFPEQAAILASGTEIELVHRDQASDVYRLGLMVETKTFEVSLPAPPQGLYDVDHLRQLYSTMEEIPFDQPSAPGTKRLLGRMRNLYLKNDLSGPLPFRQVESLALPYQTYEMALTPGLIQMAFGDRVSADVLIEGGYVFMEGGWWAPSGTLTYSPEKFHLPVRFTTPFGNTASIVYDEDALLAVRTESSDDPRFNNIVTAENDYRTLSPALVTDANGNRSAVRTDGLGLVVATALMGKEGAGEGDTLDDPTTRMDYDLFAWMNEGRPASARIFSRETHGPGTVRWKETIEFSDGLGRVIQTKTRVRPGIDGAPRWVGSGRIVFNNKGNAVKKYEPFFSGSPDYEDESSLVAAGVTPLLHYDPLGRRVRTDFPNGTFSRTHIGPWREETWDANDTVLESRWYADRGSPAPGGPAPDEPEPLVAWQTASHGGTPTVRHADVLGRAFLSVADAGPLGTWETRTVLDITQNPLAVIDPMGRTAQSQIFDMRGHPLGQNGMDTGERRVLTGVGGTPLMSWDGFGRRTRTVYDALRRPQLYYVAEPGGEEVLRRATVYGERHPDAAGKNLRGKIHRLYDESGETTAESFDFKGNPLATRRRLAKNYKGPAEWRPLAATTDDPMGLAVLAAPLLEEESFLSQTEYDALNRPVKQMTPDGSETRLFYDESGHLQASRARLAGRSETISFVVDARYNAHGKRTHILYGNGVRTESTYDPLTFRLARCRSVRPGGVVQDLIFTTDPVGNVAAVRDDAQPDVFFQNAVVSPSTRYRFDPLYRLTRAEGREHRGQHGFSQTEHDDGPRCARPHPGDGQALRRYVEEYAYDGAGNILEMVHTADQGNWVRRYRYAADGNRLEATRRPGDADGVFSDLYSHDVHGNMTSMPHLPDIRWDDNDEMRRVDLGGGGIAYYVHDAGGERIRKVIETIQGVLVEKIHVGGLDLFRERAAEGGVIRSRVSLSVMDGSSRVAVVDVETIGDGPRDPVIRFQLGNHLGSATLELNESAAVISYEEYYPYGSTAYQSGPNAAEVGLKRYRYLAQERDDETGLYKNGARTYAPWIGRWTSADPAGLVDGPNLYRYARDNPVTLADPGGMVPQDCLGGEGCGPGDDSAHQAILDEENRIQEEAAREESIRAAIAAQAEEERWLAERAAEEDQIIIEGKVPVGRSLEETRWAARQYILDHEYKGPGASNYVPPPPPDPRQKMYATMASDPIAAVFIGMALITEATAGQVFGFEVNPERAAAGGAFTSALVNGVGAMNTPPPTAGRSPADPPPAKKIQVSSTSSERATRFILQDWGIRVVKNTQNAYSFDSKTTGNVVETVLKRIEKMSQGAAIYVGSGGHGDKKGNSFVTNPRLKETNFYKDDAATIQALKDLGIGRVLDLSDPKDLKIFKEAEAMAKEPGQTHIYTLRAWCYSLRSFF